MGAILKLSLLFNVLFCLFTTLWITLCIRFWISGSPDTQIGKNFFRHYFDIQICENLSKTIFQRPERINTRFLKFWSLTAFFYKNALFYQKIHPKSYQGVDFVNVLLLLHAPPIIFVLQSTIQCSVSSTHKMCSLYWFFASIII